MEITNLLPPSGNRLLLLVGRSKMHLQLLRISAHFSQIGYVEVIDGGNYFNVYQVARHIRSSSTQVYQYLKRIHIVRSFSCYQMVTILRQTIPNNDMPLIIFDLLSSFYDENVSFTESKRLLRISFRQLQRINQNMTIIIGARFPKNCGDRVSFLFELQELASAVWEIPEQHKPYEEENYGTHTSNYLPGLSPGAKHSFGISARSAPKRSVGLG